VKPIRLTLRIALVLLVLDGLVTCLWLWLADVSRQNSTTSALSTAMLLCSLRQFIVHNRVNAWLGPSERVHRSTTMVATESYQQQTVNELASADRVLQRAPLRLALLVPGLWVSSVVVYLILGRLAFGFDLTIEQQARVLLLGLGFGLGLYAYALALADWLVAELAGENSMLSHALRVPLLRQDRPLGARIITAVVCLCVSSALVLSVAASATLCRTVNVSTPGDLEPGGLFVMILLTAAWAGGCATIVARNLRMSLAHVTSLTRRLADLGDLSSTKALPVAYPDEVGVLVEQVNRVIGSMSALADAAGAAASGNLNADIVGNGDLPEAFRKMLSTLREVVENTRETSNELASAATEISAAAQELEVASASQASGMVEIAQTMDLLSKSAAHVSDAVQGVTQNAERTLQNTEQMVSRIDSLSTHANRIGDILEVIREIANQSDLLALNGSLEATRVGEAGRGFALVAGEMRRLAERVTASVHDVKKLVADIRESGASTVVATEESKKLAEATAGAARGITLVTQQQRSSTEQVNQSVRALSEIVEQAALATTQTRASAEGLKAYADRLAKVVVGFKFAG